MKNFAFINTEYKSEWKQGEGYEKGSAVPNPDGTWAVYDGKQNYMGTIGADGTLLCAGEPTEYKHTFLRAAAAARGE